MKILIGYATYSGGTEATAEYINQLLVKKNHSVDIKYISDIDPEQIKEYDLLLLGSPSWLQNGEQGQPHAFYFNFFEKYKENQFNGTRIGLFGLGDRTYTYFCGAVDIIADFFTKRQATIIGQPLRIENFYIDNNGKEKEVKTWTQNILDLL